MTKKDKRIDAYISRSADFAQPILKHIRELVHRGCPEAEETIKWGFPNFDYHGILCGMAAFKQHCAFGFWKAPLLKDPNKYLSPPGESAMGSFGKLKKLSDLPPYKILLQFIREAAKLNEEGKTIARKPRPAVNKVLNIPNYFKKASVKTKWRPWYLKNSRIQPGKNMLNG